MATSLATSYRLLKVDYPAAWYYGPFSTLLPYPKESINLAASFEPFSFEVGYWPLVDRFRIMKAQERRETTITLRLTSMDFFQYSIERFIYFLILLNEQQVWILVVISTFAIYLFLKLALRKNVFKQSVNVEKDSVKENYGDGDCSRSNIFLIVFGNLVSQGKSVKFS